MQKLILDFEGRRLQGVRPFAIFESKDGAWTWSSDRADFPFRNSPALSNHDALQEMQNALRWCREHVGNGGAAVGFLAYDFARQIEPRAFIKDGENALGVPDARLVFHEELQDEPAPLIEGSQLRSDAPTANETATEVYLDSIARIQEYIAAGDIYQANLTQRFAAPLPCPPHELYERLRAAHATPFSALLQWDDLAIVSNSPERFLRLQGGRLLAQPIKGTMRRGRDTAEDELLKNVLQNSAKDRAENVMIVDLLRNDLGRVCEYGSVHVPRLFEVQTLPTLHHLVSTVEGELREGLDGIDALRACFPCGSITGAPKIRAMQIIDELEPVRRGVAMGAIGYLRFNGDMDWNVAIRTITCRDDTAYFHVGGGIVADSRAQDEYAEMLLKARALSRALGTMGTVV